MSAEIFLVPDSVLPVASLPDKILAARCFQQRDPHCQQAAIESRLDGPPSRGIVSITLGQRPDGMLMFLQNHDHIGTKGVMERSLAHGFALYTST